MHIYVYMHTYNTHTLQTAHLFMNAEHVYLARTTCYICTSYFIFLEELAYVIWRLASLKRAGWNAWGAADAIVLWHSKGTQFCF